MSTDFRINLQTFSARTINGLLTDLVTKLADAAGDDLMVKVDTDHEIYGLRNHGSNPFDYNEVQFMINELGNNYCVRRVVKKGGDMVEDYWLNSGNTLAELNDDGSLTVHPELQEDLKKNFALRKMG